MTTAPVSRDPSPEPILSDIVPPTRPALTSALRSVLAGARDAARAPSSTSAPTPTAPDAPPRLAQALPQAPSMPPPSSPRATHSPARPVLNATGSVFPRGLGAPPLASEAIDAMRDAARIPTIEGDELESRLAELAGAQRALVMGDAATALVLALMAHAAPGGEVVVARGALFELDDGVRITDLIAEAGAQVFETGSVDRTTAEDVADAITPATRALLVPHARRAVEGATTPPLAALASLAGRHRLTLIHAFGSGAFGPAHGEPGVRSLLADGADLVLFPGDRLLGGPSAGLIVGSDAAVVPIARLALARAGRPDRVVRAGLAATLALHRDPAEAARRIPALRALTQDILVIEERAQRLLGLLAFVDSAVMRTAPPIGGGIRPGAQIESRAVSIAVPGMAAEAVRDRLAAQTPSIAAGVAGGRVTLDLRMLDDTELGVVADGVRQLLAV